MPVFSTSLTHSVSLKCKQTNVIFPVFKHIFVGKRESIYFFTFLIHHICRSLLWLDVSWNRVEELGNYYGMEEGFSLAHLDATGNRIEELDREALLPSIKKVGLNEILLK